VGDARAALDRHRRFVGPRDGPSRSDVDAALIEFGPDRFLELLAEGRGDCVLLF
jgi:hypothetical protein